MSIILSSLDTLVTSIVHESRIDKDLKNDLIVHSQDILNSHIGQKYGMELSQLADVVKRRLLQLSPNGVNALQFTNLLSRLLDQPLLLKKHQTVLFLYVLGSATDLNQAPSTLYSLLPPLQSRKQENVVRPETINHSITPVRSKAEILREYCANKGRSSIPEALLLRDSLYLLQGISGKYIRFTLSDEEESKITFEENPIFRIPESTKTLIHRLSELGYLYSRVESFVREREGANEVGMIEQSLCHHLQTQLTEYYRLIAILETQMVIPSATGTDNSIQNRSPRRNEEIGLSLRRLDVWVNEWRLRMRMMSVCVEGAKNAQGGALVNLIHSYTDNGDPFVRKFTDKLLEEVSRPFFSTLHKWLFSGELYDPFTEFFVTLDVAIGHTPLVHPSSLSGGINNLANDGGLGVLNTESEDLSVVREGGLKLWKAKYQFRKDMLPMFVGESFGRKIYSTGKSLNFIRYSCHDSDWVTTREKMSDTPRGALQYNDIPGLERSIDAAYRIASRRLFEVFIEKFKLLDHLLALKNYLMLGNGDFAEQLMENLGPSLAKSANTLYRHNLTATLETAIRSSNAQSESADILRRLDARMLEYSHGEIGWDVFSLEYKVDAPIDTVLDPESMERYLKLFRHFWQMKRIEMALNRGWMRITGGARTFLRVPELESEWHHARLIMAEMIHFIRQMHAYCRLEVIECSWKILIDFLNKKEGDLDALIEAHRSYLNQVVKKTFLWNPKPGKEEVLHNQVKEIFSVILQFREAADNFYNYCLSESARRDQHRDTERGVYTGTINDSGSEDNLSALLKRLKEYGSSFSERIQVIVQHLQVHPDLDCRFLGIRLTFSEFYRSKKEQFRS